MIKQEMMATVIIALIFAILGALSYYEFKADFSYWTLLITGVAIGVLLSYWIFKRIYNTNIHSIKQSLEDLEELKD